MHYHLCMRQVSTRKLEISHLFLFESLFHGAVFQKFSCVSPMPKLDADFTFIRGSMCVCEHACTNMSPGLRAAVGEQRRRSSKRDKASQAGCPFLCTFFPAAPPQQLSNRVNIHKHVNWRTGALIKVRADGEIRGEGGVGCVGARAARARANQLSTTWGHLSLAPCATGGSSRIQAIFGPQRSSFETWKEEKRKADFLSGRLNWL